MAFISYFLILSSQFIMKCRYCSEDSLDKSLVDGKIVLCDWLTSGKAAIAAGAVGTVMQDGGYSDSAYIYTYRHPTWTQEMVAKFITT